MEGYMDRLNKQIVGKVIEIDKISKTGTITDHRGRDFFFALKDCKDHKFPKVNTPVVFIRDEDYVTTDVAILVIPIAA